MTFTMHIETAKGVRQHPFHLGTDLAIAEQFACEATGRDGVLSVALRCDGKVVRIFDWRDPAAELEDDIDCGVGPHGLTADEGR